MIRIPDDRRGHFVNEVSRLERDIAIALLLNIERRCRIVCTVAIKSPGNRFCDDLVIGRGFALAGDDDCVPDRAFGGWDDINAAVQTLAFALWEDLGHPATEIKVSAREDKGTADAVICMAVITPETAGALKASLANNSGR